MTTPAPIPRPSLDRAALERVLARAAELQSQENPDTGGALTDDQILDLGKEVGLTPDAMRQAIAEERGRVSLPAASGLTGAWFGAVAISAARVVPGQAPAVLASLNGVMCNELPFDVSRRFPDRMQWTPKRSFIDRMSSQFLRGTDGMDLRLSEEIAASVVGVDGQRTHVRLDASLAEIRGSAVKGSVAAVATMGLAGTLVTAIGGAAVVALPICGVLAAVGLITTRDRHRRRVLRVGTALEQLLDRLEFGPAKRTRGLVDKLLG
mgnify:CR=1 FL=1